MNILRSDSERTIRLIRLCLEIIEKKSGKTEILKSIEDIKNVTPIEVISIVEEVIDVSGNMDEKKKNLSKILNVLHKGLSNYKWELSSGNKFLKDMMDENYLLKKELSRLKKEIKGLKEETEDPISGSDKFKVLTDNILKLKNIENHFVKKENIFFPYLEKRGGHLKCLPVMWSIHDDVRRTLKEIENMKGDKIMNFEKFYSVIGELFFSMYAVIFREELILFPAASEVFSDDEWESMYEESFGIGFSFIEKKSDRSKSDFMKELSGSELIDLGSGMLDVETLKLILNSLPLDITFVDENDKVAYFSQPSARIFPRTKAIIGREVRNCHPPESIDKVDKIIDSFKNGSSSKESFRIFFREKYILIDYYAVRDREGRYKGTLEVTTDITDITKLTGEKRL